MSLVALRRWLFGFFFLLAAGAFLSPRRTYTVFYLDPELVDLTRPVFGSIVTVAAPPEPSNFVPQLQWITRTIEAIEPSVVYVYPYNAFHCTVACLASFRHALWQNASHAVQAQFLAAWESSLKTCLNNSSGLPVGQSFKVVLQRPVLSRAAAYFPVHNPSGEIEAIRSCVRQIWRNTKQPGGLPSEFARDVRVPEITHMTLLRFRAQPLRPLQWQDAFRAVAAQWHPVEIVVSKVYLALEDRPYMHIPKDARHMRPLWPA
eukprot:TRINITY_DN15514_c0_g1_i1.p1 TRINITY_DN15514_c0_g1~~TRINITY_DN15514_c0_g1_i1.p1  ORF type:complete len:272 (+),score=29.89 TRINITY_DN15514_c0_g1_i1:35-817(+)